MRALAAAVVLLTIVSPGPARGPDMLLHGAPSSVQVRGRSITGEWRGRGSGLSLTLRLEQAGDSVRGDGTYSAVRGAVGCGGETIPDSGRVTLSGELMGTRLRAHVRFSGGWGPPFIASLVHPDTLRGHFMAVDRGGCPLTLVRTR